MTKPVSRKMAVDALLHRFAEMCDARLLCPECHQLILPGQNIQFDHTHGHAMGGQHEYQNLRPIHYDPCHKAKSKRDVAALAKVDRILGLTKNKPKAKIRSRGFSKAHKPMRGRTNG